MKRFKHDVRLLADLQLLPALEGGEEWLVGGQAVIEGVMMRSPHAYCVAVRKLSGGIVTKTGELMRPSERRGFWKYPLLRGLGTLGQALALGIRALRFSADVALEEENAARRPESGKPESKAEVSSWILAANLVVSVGFFLFLYKFLPLFLATWLKRYFPAIENHFVFNFVDGVIRLLLFLGFLLAVSRWKEIKRVFEYHGAEHKVVFNFESRRPLTVENARTFTTLHPRCGTSFLLVVMMISMAVYTLLPFDGFLAKFLSRVALLPVIAGLSYEIIRFAARRRASLMAAFTAPGLWLQRITTKPPSDDQTAVAIRALEGAMALEQAQGCRPEIA